MSNYAVMPLDDYKNICDVIREKTTTEDNIKSSEIPDKISKIYEAGKFSLLKDSKYMKGTESGFTIKIEDGSPVEHDLEVKVEELAVSTDNMLTAPYTVTNTNDGGIVYQGGASISISGEASYTPSGTAINKSEFVTLYSNFEAGRTYYLSLIYVRGDATTNPLSFGFYCSGGSSPGLYGVSSIVWDSGWNNNFIVIMGQQGINYDCEVIPVLSTAPIGSGDVDDIDLSTVSVSRYGKNLLAPNYMDLPVGTTISNGITYIVSADGSININGTSTKNTSKYLYYNTKSKPDWAKVGTVITASKNADKEAEQSKVYLCVNYYDSNGVGNAGITVSGVSSKKGTVTSDWIGLVIYIHVPNGKTVNNLTIKPMIEVGDAATEYEPYIEPQTVKANADGTVEGLTSLHPNMTIISDTENVVIECNYLRDIDTYIDSLMMNIALTGGE